VAVNRLVRALAALGALAVLVAGCSSGGGGAKPSDLNGANQVGKYDGAGLIPAQPRPNFVLTDSFGKSFAFGRETAGHPTLLFFGYTHCPDECPTTMADIRLALRQVSPDVAKKTFVVFVTTDVKRDTAARLAKWLGQFAVGTKATWVGLNGTQAQINAAQAAAHVSIASDGGETHSLEVLLYGPDDYAHVAFLLTKDQPKYIAHDLSIVGAQSE
jgi:protein SCO1/2